MSLFLSLKKYQVEHYFPTNFHCRVMKRRLSTALGLVSRLFRSCSLAPTTQPKPQICGLLLIRWWNLVAATKKPYSAIATWLMTSLSQMWHGEIFYGNCYLIVVWHSSTYKIVKDIKLVLKKKCLKGLLWGILYDNYH